MSKLWPKIAIETSFDVRLQMKPEDADAMSVTLTSSGDPRDHPRELLKAFSIDINTVNIFCSDGQLTSSILLLAAVSPIVRQVGRQQNFCDCQDISLLVPDYKVHEMQLFLGLLTSKAGPISTSDQAIFTELLKYFGQDFNVQDLKKESSESDEEWTPVNDETGPIMEYDDEQEENVSSLGSKRPNFKSNYSKLIFHGLTKRVISFFQKLENSQKKFYNPMTNPGAYLFVGFVERKENGPTV